MKGTPLISVIVPVYNAEEFLPECIESLLAQTYPNIEIILVDDGSKDRSGEIADSYAGRYERVSAYHQENRRQMGARITGLSHAKGGYIGFSDSDDWMGPDTYRLMMEEALLHGSDIVSMGGVRFSGNTEKPFRDKLEAGFYDRKGIEGYILPNLFSNHDLYGNRGMQPSQCLKLFRASLIRDAYESLPLGIEIGEDLMTTYTAIAAASSLSIMDKSLVGYHYRLNPGSISWVHKERLFERSMKLCASLRGIKGLEGNEHFQREIDWEVCFFAVNAFLNEYLMKNSSRGKERKETMKAMLSSPELTAALSHVDIREIKAPNRLFIKLMEKGSLGMLHTVGMIISALRVPITRISQKVV